MRLLLILLLFPFVGLSQNYQTIRSDQINYFASANTDYILATKTDSVEFTGTDSILYAFKTLRINDTMTVSSCQYYAGASWYGDRVIIKDNGENWFFNRYQDTIVLNTQAALSDTFLLCNYSSGEFVKGWVFEHDTMTVFGQLDSVKSIQLFSNHVDFQYQDSVINLSKNHGLIDFLPIYTFPFGQYYSSYDGFYGIGPSTVVNSTMHLVGRDFPREGITRRTRAEIYDINIGDTLNKTSGNYLQAPLPPPYGYSPSTTYSQEYIMNRLDYGMDSIQIEYNRKWSHGSNLDSIWGFTIANWVTYRDLAPLQFEQVPEEVYLDSIYYDPWEDSTIYSINQNYLMLDYCGAITEGYVRYEWYRNSDSTATCFQDKIEMGYHAYNYYYVEGFGGPYFHNSEYWGTSQNAFYSGVSTCGVNWYVGLPESVDPTINLYPNPTTGQFTVDLMNANQGSLMITDLSGKMVRQDQINQEQTVVDVQDLPSGIYLVIVEIDGQRYQKKLIKN